MDQLVSPSGGGEGGPSQQNQQQAQAEAQEREREQREQFKNQVLNQILDQSARARLSTLSVVKPQKAEEITGLLINMARMGRFAPGQKINEAQLTDILEKVGGSGSAGNKGPGVTFTRRALDDDDEDDYAKIMEDL